VASVTDKASGLTRVAWQVGLFVSLRSLSLPSAPSVVNPCLPFFVCAHPRLSPLRDCGRWRM